MPRRPLHRPGGHHKSEPRLSGNRAVCVCVQLARARGSPCYDSRKYHVPHGSSRIRLYRTASRRVCARCDSPARTASRSRGPAALSERQHARVPTRHEQHHADATDACSSPATARLSSAALVTRGRAATRPHADLSTRHEPFPDAKVGAALRRAYTSSRLAGRAAAELRHHDMAHRAPGSTGATQYWQRSASGATSARMPTPP
jgi:hypothetical protein